ncbi:hypothetical protein HY571_02065 [Candidatus Micrarchaeota archaeon]|nr:hypothetical protein [Candidatus Micrarchaeota archaeon]
MTLQAKRLGLALIFHAVKVVTAIQFYGKLGASLFTKQVTRVEVDYAFALLVFLTCLSFIFYVALSSLEELDDKMRTIEMVEEKLFKCLETDCYDFLH